MKKNISKKAAMEMSVGTIVTIVLLMSVLVLGIFMIRQIFFVSTGAIDTIDNQVQGEISKLFSEEGKSLAIYPNSRTITLKKGDDPKGFAFALNNKDTTDASFTYTVSSLDTFEFAEKCGAGMNKAKADSYLLVKSGSVSLGPGSVQETPELVRFNIPETAPPCTIPYKLEIKKGTSNFQSATVYVTLK